MQERGWGMRLLARVPANAFVGRRHRFRDGHANDIEDPRRVPGPNNDNVQHRPVTQGTWKGCMAHSKYIREPTDKPMTERKNGLGGFVKFWKWRQKPWQGYIGCDFTLHSTKLYTSPSPPTVKTIQHGITAYNTGTRC